MRPMSETAFRNAVGQEMGLDPITIAAAIAALIAAVKLLPCFKKSQKAMEKNIDASYRGCCKKHGRCNAKVRRALAKAGYKDRDEQDRLWLAANKVGFANNQAVAAALVA
jgi:hypothetical protein